MYIVMCQLNLARSNCDSDVNDILDFNMLKYTWNLLRIFMNTVTENVIIFPLVLYLVKNKFKNINKF